ncbi:hypothetical protein R3P38DRAFT_3400438 [Favolaschia claudopus]|uniref:DUF6534 domain-containing protein n=1 Tax=Favolaschia claudopus TaxID=2862362 RepID=A0AAW0AQQ1_9AGAR
MSTTALDSTYGAWFISLLLETILYGMGILQTWNCFAARATDPRAVQATTVQVIFFSISSYSRFVRNFGEIQLQLLAAYLSAFIVQIYFASRIHRLTEARKPLSLSALGIYIILLLSITQIVAGIIQTVWSYELRSLLKLGTTKVCYYLAITTLQSAASLACDMLITTYLCLFLKSQKGEMMKTNSMMDLLIYDAINRGVLTALSFGVNMVLFLAVPDTFWFFLGPAPSSKLYMNSMMATLNRRQHFREAIDYNDKGWNSIPMGTLASNAGGAKVGHHGQGQASFGVVEFAETVSVDINAKRDEFPGCA